MCGTAMAVGLTCAVASAASGGPPLQARVGGPVDPAVVLSADVTVATRRIRADGSPVGVIPPRQALRFERRLVQGRWRSLVVFRDVDRPTATFGGADRELPNPFRISRVEIDEETGEATAFDLRGRRVVPPGETDVQRLGVGRAAAASIRSYGLSALTLPTSAPGTHPVPGPIAGDIVSHLGDVGTRRQSLVSRFGASTGRIRGLDRYATDAGGETTEWLVQPETALAVEINVARAGVLERRTEIQYVPYRDGHVRAVVRHERVVGGGSTDRIVTEVQFSNVATTTGGRP